MIVYIYQTQSSTLKAHIVVCNKSEKTGKDVRERKGKKNTV